MTSDGFSFQKALCECGWRSAVLRPSRRVVRAVAEQHALGTRKRKGPDRTGRGPAGAGGRSVGLGGTQNTLDAMGEVARVRHDLGGNLEVESVADHRLDGRGHAVDEHPLATA